MRWNAVWRQRVVGVVLCAALPLVSGCAAAIAGQWHLVQAKPNRDVFAIDNMHLQNNGSFTARTTIDGRTRDESGTWSFDGFKLKLRPAEGGVRTYNAWAQFGRLELKDGERFVVLAKGARK